MLYEAEPSKNFSLYATPGSSGIAGDHHVSLLRFDLSALPSSVTVTSAELYLNAKADVLMSGSVSIHPVLETWTLAQTTWIDRQTGLPWAVAGCGIGSRDTATIATFSPLQANTEYVIPLDVSAVQGWVRAPAANLGMVLVASEGADMVSFQSYMSGNPQALRPMLAVTYAP
jgi:hypothetical protein